MHAGDMIGEANFTDDGSFAFPQNVRVAPAYQRQGIATAIYVFAEKILEKPLYDFWADDPAQTSEAKALWAQPNRPFGDMSKRQGT
jgi:hypothetical protein